MFIPSCFLYVHVSFWKFLTLLPIVLPPLKYFAMCLIKRYKGKSIFQQQQIYRKKKYTSDSRYVVSIPFLNISPVAS